MNLEKMSKESRDKIAEMGMLTTKMCMMAIMAVEMDVIPDNLKECQKDLKKMHKLLRSGLISHLACHAKLQIAEEKVQKGQLNNILKECKEK